MYEEIVRETFVSPSEDYGANQEVQITWDSSLGYWIDFLSPTDEYASPSIRVDDWPAFREFVNNLLREANTKVNENPRPTLDQG
jgi:hypothetical protein